MLTPVSESLKSTAIQPAQNPGAAWFRHALACLALLVLICISYSNADHDRLFFDSQLLPLDYTLSDWSASVRRFVQSGIRPGQELTNLTFAADCEWNRRNGMPPWDLTRFVTVNVVLHAATVLCVYALIVRLGGRRQYAALLAFLAAVWFAVHPVHVASITYIVQRRGVLSTLFYLLGLHAWLSFRHASNRPLRAAWLLVLAVAFFLSLKSKTMGLTLPIAILLLEFCTRASDPLQLKRFVKAAGVVLVIFAIAVGIYLASVELPRATNAGAGGTALSRLSEAPRQFATQMRATVASWKLLAFPMPNLLCLDHQFPTTPPYDPWALAAIATNFAVVLLGIKAARNGRSALAFGILFPYVAIIPWLFITQAEQLVEYKLYLPAVGIALIGVHALDWLRSKTHVSFVGILALVVIACMIPITRQRNQLCKSPIAIWQDVLKKYPNVFRGWVSLGTSFADAGQHAQAMDAFGTANKIDPYNAQLHYYMGNSLRALGRPTDAIAEYKEARRIAGGDLPIAINLAVTLMENGRTAEAIEDLRKAIDQRWPATDNRIVAQAHLNLANALANTGATTDAETEYRSAIAAYPMYAQAHFGLGLVLDRLGRRTEAIECMLSALRFKPDLEQAKRALDEMSSRASPEAAP
ncbi:MAG: tetratricopeptide repeat protein [Planctomycetes bacterium]|nr:tetratricopeptide repeat protein [Planctomycetota bacterium]